MHSVCCSGDGQCMGVNASRSHSVCKRFGSESHEDHTQIAK